MQKNGCEVICGAPTTLLVMGQVQGGGDAQFPSCLLLLPPHGIVWCEGVYICCSYCAVYCAMYDLDFFFKQ